MNNFITKEKLKQLYRSKLLPREKMMEIERRKLKNKIVRFWCIAIAAAGIIIYFVETVPKFYKEYVSTFGMNYILCFLLLLFIFFLGLDIRRFKKKFKQTIIHEIFNLLIQDCEFRPAGKISSYDFDRSDLIQSRYNVYEGEDHVKGKIGNIQIEFSELLVTHETSKYKKKEGKTIFQGLFFKCSLEEKVQAPVLIKSDSAQSILGRSLGRFFQKIQDVTGYELVQLESVEFEKYFVVYSKDQVQARVILNPRTMEKLTSFIKKYKEWIDISLIERNLYFILHTQKNHFEPAIFSHLIKWKDVIEIYDIFNIIRDIIDQFELDQKKISTT